MGEVIAKTSEEIVRNNKGKLNLKEMPKEKNKTAQWISKDAIRELTSEKKYKIEWKINLSYKQKNSLKKKWRRKTDEI